jgi:hypothetical protein
MSEVSNVRGMSAGFSSNGDVDEGDGESTTDGMRWCPRFGFEVISVPSGDVIVTIGVREGDASGLSDGEEDIF